MKSKTLYYAGFPLGSEKLLKTRPEPKITVPEYLKLSAKEQEKFLMKKTATRSHNKIVKMFEESAEQ